MSSVKIRERHWWYFSDGWWRMGPEDEEVVNEFGKPSGLTVREAIERGRVLRVEPKTGIPYVEGEQR